jgi:hypothetical protein
MARNFGFASRSAAVAGAALCVLASLIFSGSGAVAAAGDGCAPYNDSVSHHRVYVPGNTGVAIYYTRVSGQEKSNLTIMQLLATGGWGNIWAQQDIPPGKWPDNNTTVPPLKASGNDRFFSATADFSNPNNGQPLAPRFGQYCVQLDAATNSVTEVDLWLSPHPEPGTEKVNTVVKFVYSSPIPNDKFKRD